MRYFLQIWRAFWQRDFNIKVYLPVLVFLVAAWALNYYAAPTDVFSWEKWIIINYYRERSWATYPIYFVFFALPYVVILLIKAWHSADLRSRLNQRGLWLRLTFIFGILAIQVATGIQRYVDLSDLVLGDRYYVAHVLGYLSPILMLGVPIFLFWYVRDRKTLPFMYGMSTKGFVAKPYLILLGLMIIVSGIAAFHPSFQSFYPTLKPNRLTNLTWTSNATLAFFLYEIVYGLYFIWAEVLYRGFLVIGLQKYLGDHAVLPTVGPYCFTHFAKPPGEAFSSIFGGYLLSVLSLNTQSIWGGAIIHAGIAVIMDVMAWLI